LIWRLAPFELLRPRAKQLAVPLDQSLLFKRW